jgi:hypothetical protein
MRGAGQAAYRIHKGLLRLGIQSTLWVSIRERDEPEIGQLKHRHRNFPLADRLHQVKRAVDGKLLSRVDASYEIISSGFFGHHPMPAVRNDKPNIVQLHWIGDSDRRHPGASTRAASRRRRGCKVNTSD